MLIPLNPALRPRDGRTLRVVQVARISTEHQDPRSLSDQLALCREYIHLRYDGAMDEIVLSSQGSGEHLDRADLLRLEELILSDTIDVVIAEDLGRICRRNRAIDLCESCEDHQVRLFAINDRIDTATEGWRDPATMATWHHERSNRDTSSRIKRSLIARFDRGELLERPGFGIIVPPGAKTDDDLRKDPVAENVVPEMLRRLEQGASFAEVADWLNSEGVRRGPYARKKTWDGNSVAYYVRSGKPIGLRVHNRMITTRKNKTGRHHSVKADPSQLRTRDCPHLAFVEKVYYYHVMLIIDERGKPYRRDQNGTGDVRKGVPRKRTRWPGQHMRCGVCGRILYWGMAGGVRGFVCCGAQNYVCWNSLTLSAESVTNKIAKVVLNEMQQMDGFDQELQTMIQENLNQSTDRRAQEVVELEKKKTKIKSAIVRLTEALEAEDTAPKSVMKRLTELEREDEEVDYQLNNLRTKPRVDVPIPSLAEIRSKIEACFAGECLDDPEVCRLLNLLVPEIRVLPYRDFASGRIVARATLKITLAPLLPDGVAGVCPDSLLVRTLTIDLFDEPQHIKHRQEIVRLQATGLKERQVAAQLGVTQPVVQRAAWMTREMIRLGLNDPYQPLHEPPVDDCKLQRYRHPRYRFEPLAGFPRFDSA